MSARFFRTALAAALTALAALALASPAMAAPGNGAQVVNIDQCDDVGGGFTFCQKARYVSTITETPSGNFSHDFNGRSEFTYSGPGCSTSGSDKFDQHYLRKPGEMQEEGFVTRGTYTVDCFGDRQTCEYRNHFHYANGQIQYIRSELTCTPLP